MLQENGAPTPYAIILESNKCNAHVLHAMTIMLLNSHVVQRLSMSNMFDCNSVLARMVVRKVLIAALYQCDFGHSSLLAHPSAQARSRLYARLCACFPSSNFRAFNDALLAYFSISILDLYPTFPVELHVS